MSKAVLSVSKVFFLFLLPAVHRISEGRILSALLGVFEHDFLMKVYMYNIQDTLISLKLVHSF